MCLYCIVLYRSVNPESLRDPQQQASHPPMSVMLHYTSCLCQRTCEPWCRSREGFAERKEFYSPLPAWWVTLCHWTRMSGELMNELDWGEWWVEVDGGLRWMVGWGGWWVEVDGGLRWMVGWGGWLNNRKPNNNWVVNIFQGIKAWFLLN